MSLVQPHGARLLQFLALAGVVAVAFASRLEYLIIKGGLEADQLSWAINNYAGGLTASYLAMRDGILSWTAEPHPWPYLPGYPAFLAILYEAGIRDLAFVRFVQAVIDSIAILPLYFVLHRIGTSAVPALVGSLLYAIAPWWGAGSIFVLGESLLPGLVIVLLAAMVIVRDRAVTSLPWFLLGALSSILPFFRSEMILLFGPMAVWALLTVRPGRRLVSASCVVAGFALPLLLWSARNYYVHGQFLLTPPAKWYAAWSGLGQVENGFGYFVGDERATALLASNGISYGSLQSEAYWRAAYVAAWFDHPAHVIRTILYRFGKIMGQPDTHVVFAPRISIIAYQVMAFITPLALILLLRRRHWANAFLIALPLLYALGSLGILYAEPRYVRYAGLTYVLVLPIVLTEGLALLYLAWPSRPRVVELRQLKPIVAGTALSIVIIGAASQLVRTTEKAQEAGLVARLDSGSALSPTSRLEDIMFRPTLPSVQVSRGEAGLNLRARAPAGLYLLTASMGAKASGAVIIRYQIAARKGAVGLGVLSGDSANWLSHEAPVSKSEGQVAKTFVSAVEIGSQFVIDAQGSSTEIDILASKLEWMFVCPKPVNLLTLMFSKASVPVSACVSRGGH